MGLLSSMFSPPVTKNGVQTLTNKTLDAPKVVNGLVVETGEVVAPQFSGSAAGLTGFKTINGTPILGTGDLTVAETIVRKTAAYTMVAGDSILADTSAGSFTIKLPATPTVGQSCRILDADNWSTNNLLVDPQGATIEELAAGEVLALNIGSISAEFVYSGTKWNLYITAGTWSLDTAAYLTDAPSDGKIYGRKDSAWTEVVAGGSEDTTTSLSYTYTGVMGTPPIPLPGSGSLLASPAGNERAFNVLFIGPTNPGLTGIEFTRLEVIAGNFVPTAMAALTSLSLPALTTVGGNFGPYSIGTLTDLSVPALTTIGGSFAPNTTAALTNLSVPALASIGVNFGPYAMAALTSLSLPALTAVGGNFTPYSMGTLTNLSVPVLTTVGGTFNPNNMGALTNLSLPALTTVGGGFSPNNMVALTSLSLPALTAVGGSFNPYSMTALTNLSVPALTTVVGSFNPNGLSPLTDLSLPALTMIGGNFLPSSMPGLTNLSLPAIERIGASVTSGNVIQISSGMSALTTFMLPVTLKQVGGTAGNVSITSAALNQASVDSILIRLAALDGTGGTVSFSNRTVTITGTSATPSSTGLAAKATLVARGCTVTHN